LSRAAFDGGIIFSREQLSKAVGDEIRKEEMVPAFISLIKDQEAEVRSVATNKLGGKLSCSNLRQPRHPSNMHKSRAYLPVLAAFCQLIDSDTIVDYVLHVVKELVSDQSQHVRATIALNIASLAPLLGKEVCVSACSLRIYFFFLFVL
jgi:serine/threonine-protein phosphatase 2A regulatory subunit A